MPAAPDHRRTLAALVVVLAVVAMAHAGVLGAEFAYDDHITVVENEAIRSLSAVPRFFTEHFWAGSGRDLGRNYRPLVLLGFAVDHAISGLDAGAFHRTSLVVHLGGVAVLFGLALRLSRSLWGAAVGAALYGLHPVVTEAVAGISNRGDSLVVLFGLGALWAWLGGGARHRVVGLVLVALALLSKENAVAVLPAMVAADLLVRRPRPWAAWAALGATAAAWFCLRWNAVGGMVSPEIGLLDNPIVHEPWVRQKVVAVGVIARQAAHLVVPVGLSADYGWRVVPLDTPAWSPVVLAGAALGGGWIALTAWCWRRAPEVAVGLVLAGAAYLVTSNLLVPVDALMADRFVVLPLAGLALAAPALVPRSRWSAAWLVPLAVLAVLTARRVQDWRSTEALMIAATEATPTSARAWYGVGHEAMARKAWGPADAAFARAVDLAPFYHQAWSDRSLALGELGRHAEAVASARQAVSLKPGNHLSLNNLGVALYKAGRLAESADAFSRAIEARPDFALARRNLAEVQAELALP